MNVPFPLHKVFICETVVIPQLRQFWVTIWSELAHESPYTASIGGMGIRLLKLQDDDKQAKNLKSEGLPEGWEDIKELLHYQSLPSVPKIIRSELISRHHDNPFTDHFGIEKIRELIARKYYWPTLQRDVEAYVRDCDICLASKAVYHKPYGDLQSLSVPTHWWKNLSMDFITGLPISTYWKGDSYNSILVIVDQITKMV